MNNILEVARLFFGFFEKEIVAIILTLPRIYAFMTVSQLAGFSSIPRPVRMVVVFSLAVFAAPINLTHAQMFDGTPPSYALFFLKEYAIGAVMGYIIGWVFWAVQSAGALIDNQRGAAIAGSLDPLHGEETTPLGTLFAQAFLTYVFLTGAVLHIFLLLYRSYVLWPATRGLPILDNDFPALILSIADSATRTILIIAGPVVAVMFLAELSLALISRFAPQLQVFILAMPIKSALAIFILIFYFSRFLPYAEGQLSAFEDYLGWFYEELDTSIDEGVPNDLIPREGI